MVFAEDEDILLKLRDQGQREHGFRLLISKYKLRLYHHIRRIVNDHDDTDDILQNTFLKVFRGIDGFREVSSLYTWLYRIATNESLTFIKNRAKKMVSNLEVDHISNYSKSELQQGDLSAEAITDILHKAIESLPEKQKLVFSLRYYDEMSYAQMSQITETSEGALKASYHHAVKKIEDQLRRAI